MLKKIYIDNFKCLVNFELKFDSINLLLGNNGVGKTTVFEALRQIQFFVLGGWNVSGAFPLSSCTRWQNVVTQRFELEIEGNGGIYEYILRIEHKAQQSYIKYEQLFFNNRLLLNFNMGEGEIFNDDNISVVKYSFDQSLSMLPAITQRPDNMKLTWFRNRMLRFINIKISPNQMDSVSEKEQFLLNQSVDNYSSWYRYISQDQGKVFELINYFKEILDGFVSFKFENFDDRRMVLNARFSSEQDKNKIVSYRLDELSDGQKALVALYTILLSTKSEDYTLCIDEPENFLALPEIQPWLVELYDFCSEGKIQALLISHHPRLIDYLVSPSGEMLGNYFFERESNKPTQVRKLDHQETEEGGLKMSELVARGWV